MPDPGSEGVDRHTGIELEVAAEPLAGGAGDAPPRWRLSGAQSGPHRADEVRLTIEPLPASGTYLLRWSLERPFLPGEEVRIELRRAWPLASGRELPGLYATFRTAPGITSANLLAGLEPPPADPPGRFEEVQRLELSAGPCFAVAADFDRDGAVDLAVADVLGHDAIHVLLNNGLGRLTPAGSYTIEGLEDPGRFATCDVNGDGWLDLVVIGQKTGNLAILAGAGDGTFVTTTRFELAGQTPVEVAIADLDLDGLQDLLITDLEEASIALLRGDGQAPSGFAAEQRLPALPGAQALAVTNLDGDLRADVALASSENNTVAVMLGAGGDTGAAPLLESAYAIPTGRRPRQVTTGDLDLDGRTDLVVTEQGSNQVSVFLGRGDGTFEPPWSQPVGDRPEMPALADLNGDGFLDLAVPNLFSDEVTLLWGAGDGTFPIVETLPVGAGPVAVVAADFDGDGDLDLAVVHSVADDVTLYANRQRELAAERANEGPRSLDQNTPNPFNPNTTITFTLLAPSHVELVVFNTSGKVVRTLVDEPRQAGHHSAFWDGTDEGGKDVPSGIYFYRLTTDETVELRRMTLLR